MGTYTRRFRFKHPTPDDLLAVFDEVCGKACADNFRAALFDEGWVDYVALSAASARAREAAGFYDRDGKREKLDGAQKQGYEGWVLVSRRGTLSFPVDVELTLGDGTKQRVRWDAATSWARLPYKGDKPLVAVVVDPDHTVLLDEKLTNNHALAADAPRSSTSRTLERVAYWASLALQVAGP